MFAVASILDRILDRRHFGGCRQRAGPGGARASLTSVLSTRRHVGGGTSAPLRDMRQDGVAGEEERCPMLLVRRWWPVPALIVSSLVVQKVFFESRYDVSGHAAEHLSSANAPFAAFAVV